MNWILAIPMEIRLLLLFAAGMILGSAINLAVYRLAWNPRPVSPWMRPHLSAPGRRWFDRVPVFGWLGMRREAHLHGSGFWIRPLLVELLTGLGLAWLYYWEIGLVGLFPADMPRPPNPALPAGLFSMLHEQFAAHAAMICLMLAASLIDADEKIIPDAITRPGTLLGLLLASLWPRSLLPDVYLQSEGNWRFNILSITAPNQWPEWLDGSPNAGSLAIALGCWVLWCLAILPRTWHARHGCKRAFRLCWTRIIRQTDTYRILFMCAAGAALTAGVWGYDGKNWKTLLSALVGMAAGGAIIWTVRNIGRLVLGQEAMGFGDVTLMCMFGAFLGWQACLIVFFLAPFAALTLGLARYIFLRDREIPYGPFLCMAALATIVLWSPIWDWACGIFTLGWFVPLVMFACLLLIGPMLFLIRMLLDFIRASRG